MAVYNFIPIAREQLNVAYNARNPEGADWFYG
jgi:hypothetical protein